KMENLNEVMVKELRSDNETEFKIYKLEDFCDEKGDAISFNENRSFPEDEFIEPRPKNTQCSVNIEYFPYLTMNMFTDFADTLESAEPQDNVLSESISDRWSREKHIELVNINGEPLASITTRSRIRDSEAASAYKCLYVNFLLEIEPKKLIEALEEEGWVHAMIEERNQFERNKVWTLVPKPYGKTIIGLKWVFRNKMDKEWVVTKNKARLVSKCYRQEEGIYYDETFTPSARLEAIRIFFAYASYMGFIVFQMDVKSAFLNGKLLEEVYVEQPPRFESSEFPNHVCRLNKALYGLKQAPRACEAKEKNAAKCYAQVLWIKSQLADYDVLYDKIPIFCGNTSAIVISNNPVLHSRTKHIDISICTALTKEPLAMYVEYLKEFLYTAKVDDATKDISFSLPFLKTNSPSPALIFSLLLLTDSKTDVPIPPKGTVRAELATLGLTDKDKPFLTSTEIVNSSPLKLNLTSHMLKVAKLSKEPEKSLILPSEGVHAKEFADKSQSKTNVQPLSQSKDPTARKPRKEKITSSSQPKVLQSSMSILTSSPPTTYIQHTEEFVVTDYATKSLDASKLAEAQGIQPSTAETKKEIAKEHPIVIPSDEMSESLYDTESEINFIKSFKAKTISDYAVSSFKLSSMPDDDLHSTSPFDTIKSGDKDDNTDMASSEHISNEGTTDTFLHASAKFHSLSGHLDHLHQTVIKPMKKQFNIYHKAESERFVILQTQLTKVLKSEIGKSVSSKVCNQMQEVIDDLKTHNNTLGRFFLDVQDDKSSEGKELVVHTSKEKKDGIISVEDDLDEDDKETLSKRFKITPLDTQNPIPLCSSIPEHPLKPEEQQKSLQEFTYELFKTTFSKFSPTPPIDP
nr:retrovirus-related Pol polyprotein from transposon TNT 1-94 [Tanacetum cinerariifolium]